MSELQSDSIESEVIETEVIEDQTNGADLATASESEHEAKPEVDEEAAKQAAIQKTINKKHFETQQAKRDLEAANSRIAEFESRQREEMAAKVGTIPNMPDPFDDDFDEKVKQRDEALIAQANFNQRNDNYQAQQQFQQQEVQRAKQVEVQKILQAHNGRVKALGITPEAMQAAENAVVGYELPKDMMVFIAGGNDSPEVMNYLAANPVEAFELSNMARSNDYEAGNLLRDIKQKASTLKPKTSNAPKPGDDLRGRGAKPNDGFLYLDGATFE
jgi:hypothetical protein